jgi:hypothetical protein
MNVPIPGPATLHREARALGQVPDFGLSLAPFAWLVIAQGLKGVLNDPFAPPLVRAVAWLTLKGVAARACPAGSLAAAGGVRGSVCPVGTRSEGTRMNANGLATAIPGPWFVTAAQYHHDTSVVGHTMLEVARKSLRLYKGLFVDGTILPKPPTPEMLLGQALHVWVWEPERWAERTAIVPAGLDRRTKAGRLAWGRFLAESAGKILLTGEQSEQVRRMGDGLLENPFARELYEHAGRRELAVRWCWGTDELWLTVKNRFDAILDTGFILDLKSCCDPSPEGFARAAAAHGYHRQAALYRFGAEIALGLQADFLFLAVGNQEPYEAFVYELDPEAQALGFRQNEETLTRLAQALRYGKWDSPGSGRVNELALPRWAYQGAGL